MDYPNDQAKFEGLLKAAEQAVQRDQDQINLLTKAMDHLKDYENLYGRVYEEDSLMALEQLRREYAKVEVRLARHTGELWGLSIAKKFVS